MAQEGLEEPSHVMVRQGGGEETPYARGWGSSQEEQPKEQWLHGRRRA